MSSVIRYLTPADGAEEDPQFSGKIRVTDDGKISIIDVLACAMYGNPDGTYKTNAHKMASITFLRLQKEHKEVKTACLHFKFPGPGQRDTPVTDRQGMTKIIMLLPGKIAAKFRDSVAVLLERYLEADRSLAEDILRRADAKEGAIANLGDHPRIRSCMATKRLNGCIKEYSDNHKGCGVLYPAVHDINNLAVTGKTAKELKTLHSARDSMSSRDLETESQLAAMYFLQIREAEKLKADSQLNPVEVAKRTRDMFEPVFRADGLHDAVADVGRVKENAKVMRLNQRADRVARIANE